MKVFAIVLLLATVAYGLVPDFSSAPAVALLAKADEFVGELQETEDGPIVTIGNPAPEGVESAPPTGPMYGIPSCKLGLKFGTPICIAKCISRGHIAGYCKGNKCTCVG